MSHPSYHKFSPLLLAGLSLIAIVAYFIVIADSQLTKLLKFEKSRAEILALAQQALDESPMGQFSLRRDFEIKTDESLMRYVQQHALAESLRVQLPLAQWVVSWQGEVENPEGKKEKASFEVEYDLFGQLAGFSQTYPGLKDALNMPEAEALRLAKDFLYAQGRDTVAIKLSQKKTTEEEGGSKYNFTFTRALPFATDLTEEFSIDVAGSKVTEFNQTITHPESKRPGLNHEQIVELVFLGIALILWLIIIVIHLTEFLRRLRHDEVEFKRAWWWGLLGFVMMFAAVTFQAWPEWAAIAFGSTFSGLFCGAAFVLVYATTESLNRDVSPERVVVSDLVQRGQLRVKEVGAAILRAFFIAGVALLAWSILIWIMGTAKIGYFEIDHEKFWFLRAFRYWAGNMLQVITGVGFIGLLFLSFWNAYLHSKIKRASVLFLMLMLSLHFAGFYNYFIKPTWLGALLGLPLAAVWTYFVKDEDLFTNLLALFIFYLLFNLALIAASPADLLTGPLLWFIFFFTVLLSCGIYFYKSKNIAQDFENYVPEYVSRIAARERFLKELEIARNVQMRFLPARVPEFPGLELASICRPAMEVGGDYFDFVPHGKEALSVFIGDVSGKGVSAAFFMTMAKGIIKTLVKKIASPKQLLTEMNEVFYENSPKEVFISLIYGYFDMRRRTLTFARAGHNPLIVRKSQGNEPERLHPKGLAIGMDAGYHFARTIEEITVPITPGDVFVFYTDGISESMNTLGDEFGEERLCELINQNAQDEAPVLMERITREINSFANGANQHDDFTMVVVKVRG